MTADKLILHHAMDRIKQILIEADVAATIVLTTPKINGEPMEFETATYDHVQTSFSAAQTFKHYCCPQHGMVDGLMIHIDEKRYPDEEQSKKALQQTAGIFIALDRAVVKASKKYQAVLGEISARVNAAVNGQPTNIAPNKPNLN